MSSARKTITPGRIVTVAELQALGHKPSIILKNDFGIAAIKSRRIIPPAVSQELASLNEQQLDVMNHKPQIHYDADAEPGRRTHMDPGIPPLIGAFVQQTLSEIVDSTGCRGGRASFVIGQYIKDPLHIDHKFMAHLHLTSEFGMWCYSFKRGVLTVKDHAGFIDIERDELQRRIQAGEAERHQLQVGELLTFSPNLAHESNPDAPPDANHIRAMMVLNPRVYL